MRWMMFKICQKHNKTYNTKVGCKDCLEARKKVKKKSEKKVFRKTCMNCNVPSHGDLCRKCYRKSIKKKKKVVLKTRCKECKAICWGNLCKECFAKHSKKSDDVKRFLKKLKSNGTFTEKIKSEKTFNQTMEEMSNAKL